ncbi:MAG: hypothetical protein ACXVZ1_05260 [Gaiellaceae bacterium]
MIELAPASRGAYGLRFEGLQSSALVSPVPPGWPRVEVERRSLDEYVRATRVPDTLLELTYPNGWALRAERESRSLTFFVPASVADDELVHPFLSPPAVDFACRLGRTVFHAGAFVAEGAAWALLGEREGGKSTKLAMLAQAGAPVVCDDILVLDGTDVLAGPRCVDLRPEAAARLSGQAPEVRGGLRRRLDLPQIQPVVPLGGFFFLVWDDMVGAEPLGASERLGELSRYCRPEVQAIGSLLDLAQLPAWRLGRPRRLDVIDEVCRKLLETAAG